MLAPLRAPCGRNFAVRLRDGRLLNTQYLLGNLKDRVINSIVFFYLSQGGYVFIGVSQLAGLRKNYSNFSHNIRWKGGTWARKKPLDFDGNLDHVALGLGLGLRLRLGDGWEHRYTLSLSLYLSLYFLGGPGIAGTRMSPFWILLELRVIDVVVTTGAIRREKSPPTSQHPVCRGGCATRCLFDNNNCTCDISGLFWGIRSTECHSSYHMHSYNSLGGGNRLMIILSLCNNVMHTCSSPSRSGHSPAAKRIIVFWRLKISGRSRDRL